MMNTSAVTVAGLIDKNKIMDTENRYRWLINFIIEKGTKVSIRRTSITSAPSYYYLLDYEGWCGNDEIILDAKLKFESGSHTRNLEMEFSFYRRVEYDEHKVRTEQISKGVEFLHDFEWDDNKCEKRLSDNAIKIIEYFKINSNLIR